MRAIIFDLGHTLIDYRYDFRAMSDEAEEGMCALVKGRVVDQEAFRNYLHLQLERTREYKLSNMVEVPLREVLEEVLDHFGVQDPDVVAKGVEVFYQAITSTKRQVVGVVELLRDLKQAGYLVGLISDVAWGLPSELPMRDVREFGLEPYLDDAVFSSDVRLRKPHPELFNMSLRNLDVEAGEAAYVGNTRWADVYGAKSVGMTAILVRSNYDIPSDVEPDHFLESILELRDVLDL